MTIGNFYNTIVPVTIVPWQVQSLKTLVDRLGYRMLQINKNFWNSCEFLKEDQWLRNKISVLQARSRAALFVWFESFYNLKVIWTGKEKWESLRQKMGRYPQKSALENIRAVRHYLYKQRLDIKVQFFDFTILIFFYFSRIIQMCQRMVTMLRVSLYIYAYPGFQLVSEYSVILS